MAAINLDDFDLEDFSLDVFELSNRTNGKPLLWVGNYLFKYYNLIEEFKLDQQILTNFFNAVESIYQTKNPYHNNIHAADVTWSLHYFLHKSGLHNRLTKLELFSCILAAIIHDCDHPGFNNLFLISTGHPLAITHNDISVLENHHCSTAFKLAKIDENNIFKVLTLEQRLFLRKLTIYLVLGTDFGRHNEFMKEFEDLSARGWPMESQEDRNRVILITLKCADLGHVSKKFNLHKNWALRITEEFLNQGDTEKTLGLKVSIGMDRDTLELPKSQTFFIGMLVLPMYKIFTSYFTGCADRLAQLQENLNFWSSPSQQP